MGSAWDQTLLDQAITDSNGDPVANASVQVTAVPVDPSSWTGAYPVLGYGTTDDNGDVDVAISPGDLINDPDFASDGSLTLQVEWQGFDTNWYDGPQVTDSFGETTDPFLDQYQLMDSSNNPIADTPVLIRAQPVGASSCTSSCPQVGIGTTDSLGMVDTTMDLSCGHRQLDLRPLKPGRDL